jgi:hypothetical protein
VCDEERHSRMAGSSAEAVCNGCMRLVPVGEVTASCVTTAKYDACALLHCTVHTVIYPGVQECTFGNFIQRTTAKSTYVSRQFLHLTFVANRWIKLGMYFEFIYYLTYAEPS